MSQRFRKTDAGRAEIRERRLDLPRPARNLLLILDESKPGDEWLALVAGATADDLRRLADTGLVAEAEAPPPPPPRAAAVTAPAAVPLDVSAAGFRALYDFLTAQAKPRLGLVKGYRAVLDIERCTDVDALRGFAARFVAQVREAQGEAAAQELVRELSALR